MSDILKKKRGAMWTPPPVNTVNVNFHKRLFNKIYWHILRAFDNIGIRYIWIYGGSSAAKTYSVVQLLIVKMLTDKSETAMVFRKYSVDIQFSIYADFEEIIDEWNLREHFILQKHYIECKLTGAYIAFRGLDDSEKVKGIAGFKRIILEEVSQFDFDDLRQIRKRLRGKIGQQIIGIFNPINEEHWIKTKVFDIETLIDNDIDIAGMQVNASGDLVILKTNYLDNEWIVGPKFVDQHTINDFEKDKINDNAYYQIYGLGNWGKIRTGGEFWKSFKYDRNTTGLGWNEALPIFQTWDENVNPYITCLLWQIYGPETMKLIQEYIEVNHPALVGKKYIAVQIDEICLEDPRNRVKDACIEFQKRFPVERVKGLFVGGDRTSIREDTKLEKGENFFTKIIEYLLGYRPLMRMQGVNPSIIQSAGFIDKCYALETDVAILINRRCKRSLHDYQYALEDSDGTLKKTKKTNPITKVSYEEFGHPSDAKRYFVTINFQEDYMKYLKGGRTTIPISGKNISKHSV